MSRGRSAVLLTLAGLTAVTGCSGGSAAPGASPTPTPTPTASASTPVAEALQQLAAAGAKASYRATYVAHQAKPSRQATWLVARTPVSLRLDVVDRGVTATLIVSTKGTFACKAVGRRKTCFRVARPGRPVPAPFELAPRALFTSDLSALAGHPDSYDVQAAAADGAYSCFAIKALAGAPAPVPTGTYCFAPSGVLTSVRFSTGSSARVTSYSLSAPPATLFVPYSSPTPLPG